MTAYRSNENSLTNSALKFARHNDAHSNDALEILLTNIYTATPEAIIVQSGVNYRATDFQAWAIYYDPTQIFNPAKPNKFEVISQVANENPYAYTGTYEIFNETDIGGGIPVGDYFCITSVDYQAEGVYDIINSINPMSALAGLIVKISDTNFINTGVRNITVNYEDAGILVQSTFEGSPVSEFEAAPVDNCAFLVTNGGTITGHPLPAHTTSGRFGILLSQYNTDF
jgi:hypothetical protein